MSISISFVDSDQPARHHDGPLVRIGRSRQADLVIPTELCPGVSSNHAAIELRGGRMYLRDLGSANGTFLNGRRVDGEEPLVSGDLVTLGTNGPGLRVTLGAEGPTQVAATVPSRLGKPPTSRKRAVGMGTMMFLLDRERARGRRLLLLTIGLLGLVALAGLALVYIDAKRAVDETRDELAAGNLRLVEAQRQQQARLEEIDRSQAARIVELMQALQQSDQRLAELANRQDLSEDSRAQMADNLQRQRQELVDQLGKAQVQQGSTKAETEDWAALVDRYAASVFLCVAADGEGRVNIGTAFVIDRSGVLATNAHVVRQLQAMPTRRVIQNRSGRIFPIERMIAHPDFEQPNSPDVGLIRIELDDEGELPALPLADAQRLSVLPIGSQLGTIGFPGELLAQYLGNVDRERERFTGVLATFKDGWLGRYTDYNGRYSEDGGNTLIQHSASLSGGTSGSPMFLRDGTVVAISSSTFTDGPQTTDGPATPTSSEIAFAIRIDELRELLAMSGWLD